MKKYLIALPFLILASSLSLSAQETPPDAVVNAKEEAAKLQEAAVEYLRETPAEINLLRTFENRISFNSELANLMWYHDEKEARKMFEGVTGDFIQLMSQANSRLISLGGWKNDRLGGGFMGSRDERSMAARKVMVGMSVRQQIALAIAEHDAQFGYDFAIRTAGIVTDEKLRERINGQNEQLERRLIERISVSKPEQSLAFARKSLKRGFKRELVGLAAKIYKKDPEGAIEFGKDLVSKVRSEASVESKSHRNIYSILRAGASSEDAKRDGQKPLFEQGDLRELAELLAKNLLDSIGDEVYTPSEYLEEIKKYAPVFAKRLEDKQKEFEKSSDKAGDATGPDDSRSFPAPKPAPVQFAENEKSRKQRELMKDLRDFDENRLTDDQKAEFIGKARGIVAEMNDPTMKVFALSALAGQVKTLGDDELAIEIMREANVLVKQNPQNYVDYMLVWSLATGYSKVEPDEAFLLIEGAIFRLNETIAAMVKVAEFIDVRGDFVIDREVQVGAFGGSMTRGVIGAISTSDNVLRDLSIADFDRTKGLVQKFEQPEVRILVRFMVLRSLLQNSKTKAIGLVK
jgi:hypothetical protein